MAANAFMSFFDKADGESIRKGKEKWVEVHGWDWGIDADTSWTKGGGASVGKPSPGAMSWTHDFDTASPVLLGYICTGKAFPKVELQMMKAAGGGAPDTWFTMTMEDVFLTSVGQTGTDEGDVVQQVRMVFKTVKIDCKPRDPKTGKLGSAKSFNWDIPAGTASSSP
jgi:type VI secretion system secreted protein Hcp